ncbi:MAG: hypothetical protein A3J74_06610 [Elusimicrobia bacterium RIFCSPHIGHO2_02_FULL_57_9]|nr:MAG: hypothetical protein A3J74_06610 [Elusimicrobia bacterium RIFCSPHIGHO2_02_FULL_57_9]
MAIIGVVCADEDERARLSLIAGESGHLVHGAPRLEQALEILRENRPRLMLVVDSSEQDAQSVMREMSRVSPLLPVVVALKNRDANRAVALMRQGAAEVIAPPWTRENIRACLAKTMRLQGTAFSVETPPRPRSVLLYFFFVLAFFAVCFSALALKRQAWLKAQALAARDFWDLPYKHPAAMGFDGKELWIVDWFTQSLYLHDANGLALRRLVHLTAETPVALTFATDAVWTVAASGMIIRRMKNAALTPLEKYKDAAPNTLGMAFDGLYLWTCDSRLNQLHKHLIDFQLSLVASYPYPGFRPAALVFDGKTLWSLDAANRELIQHNLERPDEAVGRVPLPEYRDGRFKPVGLGWDGERFWTVGEKERESGPARVFRHAVVRF